MPKARKCPLCGSSLTAAHWLAVTGHWREKQELIAKAQQREKAAEKRGEQKQIQRTRYLQSLLQKSNDKQDALQKQNKELRKRLKEGITPQVAGVKDEFDLCRKLRRAFGDLVTHHGQGGDVLHHILVNGRKVGTLVYECKKTQRVPRHFIEQARQAMLERKADYTILVAAASKANTFGFWTEKDVLIVHPAGVLALVHWLRGFMIRMAQAKMTQKQREKTAKAIMDYLDSPEFRNPLRDVVRRSEQLGQTLVGEIKTHRNLWLDRLFHYEEIWNDGHNISRGFDRVLEEHSLRKERSRPIVHSRAAKPAYPFKKELLMLPRKSS
jgi:hypothetical protein